MWKEEGKGRPLQWGNTALVVRVIFESRNLYFAGRNPASSSAMSNCAGVSVNPAPGNAFTLLFFWADGILSHRRGKQLKCLPGYFRGANVTPCLSWAGCNTLFTCTSDTHLATKGRVRLYKIHNPLLIWVVMQVVAVPVDTEVSSVPPVEKEINQH